MDSVHQILNVAKNLSEKELLQVSESLLKLLRQTNGVQGVSAKRVEKCRKCNSEQIVKFGVDKNGKQRYKCKCCGATFTETSYSVVAGTRHSDAVWEKYIRLLLLGVSLEECARQCKISVRTAFIWRHKILHALQKDQTDRVLGGIIEADEMFLPVSYKGNHKKSKRFAMPRAAFKRGSDNHAHKTPKACIMCAVERNGQRYGEVLGQGQPTTQMIDHAFGKRIASGSILLADGAQAMKNYYAKKKDVGLIRLKSNVTGKPNSKIPEIRGAYHIQTVNNLHARLHGFLRDYRGVSTKYLNHYVSLFIWIDNHKTAENLADALKDYIAEKRDYTPAVSLFELPPVPQAA